MTSPYFPSHDADGEVVMFTDRDGITWSAREVPGDRIDGGHGDRAGRCLVFASLGRHRHLWHYPADWRDLSADELQALSARSADAA